MSLPATMAEAKQGRVYECVVPDCLYFMDDLGNCLVYLMVADATGVAGDPPESYKPVRYVGLWKDVFSYNGESQ